MVELRMFIILILLSESLTFPPKELIYRRFERKHSKKNFIEVIEIFDTRNAPPLYTPENESLNNFLAKDSMNCTTISETQPESDLRTQVVSKTPNSTAIITDKTTTPRVSTSSPTYWDIINKYTVRPPSLNNLFTPRPTKPTILPNPRENNNPDYTNLLTWPKPNVQVTKHPPSTFPTTMIIKETDDHPNRNLTTLFNVNENEMIEPVAIANITTSSTTTTTTTMAAPVLAEPISIDENVEESIEKSDQFPDDGYEEKSYDVLSDDDIDGVNKNGTNLEPEYDYREEDDDDVDDDDDEEELSKRKKRNRKLWRKPVKALKLKHMSKF